MIKLKVSKEELLQWYEDNDTTITAKQVRAYNSDDWDNFFDDNAMGRELMMYKEYFEEPEPNYNEMIGEDCVFSNSKPNKERIIDWLPIHESILKAHSVGYDKTFKSAVIIMDKYGNICNDWKYCMLKTDYIKLLKEQSNG